MPGVAMSRMSTLIPRCFESGAPVRTYRKHICDHMAYDVHTF